MEQSKRKVKKIFTLVDFNCKQTLSEPLMTVMKGRGITHMAQGISEKMKNPVALFYKTV